MTTDLVSEAFICSFSATSLNADSQTWFLIMCGTINQQLIAANVPTCTPPRSVNRTVRVPVMWLSCYINLIHSRSETHTLG